MTYNLINFIGSNRWFDFIDRVINDLHRSSEQIAVQAIHVFPGQLDVQILFAVDCLDLKYFLFVYILKYPKFYMNGRILSERQCLLRFDDSCPDSLENLLLRIGRQIDARLRFECFDNVIEKILVEVLTTEVKVARNGFNN